MTAAFKDFIKTGEPGLGLSHLSSSHLYIFAGLRIDEGVDLHFRRNALGRLGGFAGGRLKMHSFKGFRP